MNCIFPSQLLWWVFEPKPPIAIRAEDLLQCIPSCLQIDRLFKCRWQREFVQEYSDSARLQFIHESLDRTHIFHNHFFVYWLIPLQPVLFDALLVVISDGRGCQSRTSFARIKRWLMQIELSL